MALFLPTDTFAYVDATEKIVRVDGTDVIDRGFWSGSMAYQPMDVVQFDNMLFVALAANFNMSPTAIVDDNWSSLVRFNEQQPEHTAEEAYQIAVAGSILAWNTYGSLVAGDFLPNQPKVVQCSHINWGTTGDQVNAGQMPYNATYATVQDALDAIFYVPLQVTSFGNTVNVAEIGATVPNTTLSWVYNKAVTSQSIDQGIGVLASGLRTTPATGPWTNGITWTVTASDGTVTAHRSTGISFMNRRYWGPDASPAINDAGIIALSSEFASSFSQSRTITAAAQYIYFAFPSSFGTPQFTVNGLLNTAWTKTTRSFVNASGHASSYDIWRSDNLLTGTYNITLS